MEEHEQQWQNNPDNARVGIIMGSDSDLPVMIEAVDVLVELQVDHECRIISAHRTPDKMRDYALTAEERGIQVIIAGAGGAAHLPGMTEAFADRLPIIGVPVVSQGRAALQESSLYSIVDMPPGKPVSTMAPNGSRNAGIEAAKILSLHDEGLKGRLREMSAKMALDVEKKDKRIQEIGPQAYLDEMNGRNPDEPTILLF